MKVILLSDVKKVGKKGVVRDPAVHENVIKTIAEFAVSQKFQVLGLEHSPVKGPEGNIEYLGYLSAQPGPDYEGDLRELVSQSHEGLKEGEE